MLTILETDVKDLQCFEGTHGVLFKVFVVRNEI